MKYRVDAETGKNMYAIVQAEDEIASIGMVVGAGWNGARAFTTTSGPGISLMTEFIGLAYMAEIPVTIINVQRGGPSTGMPTRTQQADILSCAYASHGDTKHVLLFPEDPKECFEHAAAALDLAYLAAGRFDGFWELKLKPWDTAAGCLMVEEAGGRISDIKGDRWHLQSANILASNGFIHEQMIKILQNVE